MNRDLNAIQYISSWYTFHWHCWRLNNYLEYLHSSVELCTK